MKSRARSRDYLGDNIRGQLAHLAYIVEKPQLLGNREHTCTHRDFPSFSLKQLEHFANEEALDQYFQHQHLAKPY